MITKKMTGQIELEVTSVTESEAIGKMPVGPGILNPFGTIHAAALIWLADVVATNLAFGDIPLTEESMGSFPVAVTLNAQLLANQREGNVTARAVWVKKGRRISTVRTEVTDDNGRVLLDLTSTHVSAK